MTAIPGESVGDCVLPAFPDAQAREEGLMTQLRCWISVAAIAVAVALAAPAIAETFSGRVVGITDGDTVTVLRGGEAIKVRLGGIDCPERGQDFRTRARQAASDLVFGKTVRVEVRDHDQGGTVVSPRQVCASGVFRS
jgi:micrococcal nuclease